MIALITLFVLRRLRGNPQTLMQCTKTQYTGFVCKREKIIYPVVTRDFRKEVIRGRNKLLVINKTSLNV